NKTLGSYIKKASGVDTEPGFVDWRKRNDVMTLAYDAEGITDAGGDASEFRNKLKNRQKGIGTAVDRITKPMSEQAEYISSLENAVIVLAESMNMSVEDLLNEGEMRNRRLAGALNKAGDNVRIGKTRLAAMDSHVSNVAKTQGGEAGNAADSALFRLRGPAERGVRDAQVKSGKLQTALNTGMASVVRSRASRVARGSFSNKPKEIAQADRIRSIGGGIQTSQAALHTRETPKTYTNPNGGKEVTMGTVAKVGSTSSASLAAQGKLPTKKFGTGADQKTNLAAKGIDSTAKRADQAAIQSYAQQARNKANKPV
ncbi:MAG: hypothetical protein EBY29_02870, partial [Planctomycetes bacterium]|nr:hypothetical protein [Planctomycetota bacterium]